MFWATTHEWGDSSMKLYKALKHKVGNRNHMLTRIVWYVLEWFRITDLIIRWTSQLNEHLNCCLDVCISVGWSSEHDGILRRKSPQLKTTTPDLLIKLSKRQLVKLQLEIDELIK